MYLRNGSVGLASGMAGTRSSNDMAGTRSSNNRTQSLFLSWPCFLLWRLSSQEGFLCRVIKMPPTVLYHPSSLLIPGKKKVVTRCWRKSLLVLAWVIWPFLVQSVRSGRWSTLATCALSVHFWYQQLRSTLLKWHCRKSRSPRRNKTGKNVCLLCLELPLSSFTDKVTEAKRSYGDLRSEPGSGREQFKPSLPDSKW